MYEQLAGQPLSGETHAATWSLILPATPDKTGQARRFLAAILNGCALAGDAVACLGELANNAVIHSDSRLPGGTFSVRVQTRPGRLRVEVHDSGGPWAPRRTSGDGDPASGGRGLLIVSQLAGRWGVTPTTTAPHRTVWFEIDLPCPPALPEGEPAMPDTSHPVSRAGEEAAWWLEDIAGHLTAADLPARLHHTPHSTYLTATAGTRTGAGTGEIEATIDDDSYCEIRFWVAAGATPAQAAAIVTRAITAITS